MTLSAPSVAGQVLAWAGSAVAAAAVLSGVAVLMAAAPPPGESRGQVTAPVVLTLVGPEAVAAIATPPPDVASEVAFAPVAVPVPGLAAPVPQAELPPRAEAAPRLSSVPTGRDAPVVADAPPPMPKAEPAATPKAAPAATPKAAPVVKPEVQPAAKAKPAQPAAAASAAASVAGDAGRAADATRNDGVRGGSAAAKDAEKRWASSIRKRIEAKKSYPAAAQGAGGTVTVRLTVSRAGQLLGVAVVASSGVAALDRAAVRAVQSSRFPKAPDGVGGDSASFTLPMKFAG